VPAVSSTCLKLQSAQQGCHSFWCQLFGLCPGVMGIGSPCGPYPHSRGKDLSHGSAGIPALREVYSWFWVCTLHWLSPYLGLEQWPLRKEPQRWHRMLMGAELGPERLVRVEQADSTEGGCFGWGLDHGFARKGG